MKPFFIAIALLAACVAIPALMLLALFCRPRAKRVALAQALFADSDPGVGQHPPPAASALRRPPSRDADAFVSMDGST